MTDIWSAFDDIPVSGAEASTPPLLKQAPAAGAEFPEWEEGGGAKARLPIGLKLGANTAVCRAAPQATSTDLEANAQLWKFLGSKAQLARENGFLALTYIANRPDLVARVAKVRVGVNRLTDRLNAEFHGLFMPREVGALAGLVPKSGATTSRSEQPQLPSKAARRAQRAGEEAAKRVQRAEEEAARKAEQLRLFLERCRTITERGDPGEIIDFALEDSRFEAMLGVGIARMISAVDVEESPTLVWKPEPKCALSEAAREAVEAACAERWLKARADHLLALKRTAAALKAAETRRKRAEEKRLVAEAEARKLALEKRRVALPVALAARNKGPDALVAFLAENEAARSLLKAMGEESVPPLVLTDAEMEVENQRQQAIVDQKGIWRKDVQARCPGLKDSEIERLYKTGYLKVLRTVEIKKQGRWINARLYDPACVRRLTPEWIEQWRGKGKKVSA